MTAYTPQHSVRAGELASRIYTGWLTAAAGEDIPGANLKDWAGFACDAAAILLTELRRRDPITCELIHSQLPMDVETETEDGS